MLDVNRHSHEDVEAADSGVQEAQLGQPVHPSLLVFITKHLCVQWATY